MTSKRPSDRPRPATSIAAYDAAQPAAEASICRRLRAEIERLLPGATARLWHGAPVWFLGYSPVVGYRVPARGGVALQFWNGQAFGDPALAPSGKSQAARIHFGDLREVDAAPLRRWLERARTPHSDPTAPILLAGGNPRIAKADGDAPVQAYLAAMPGWQRDVGRRLDALVERSVPGLRKAVKWNSPFYGRDGQGWFLSFHCFANYVKVAFFRGSSLRPPPPVESKNESTRYFHIHEHDPFDEARLAAWVIQASRLPGWGGT